MRKKRSGTFLLGAVLTGAVLLATIVGAVWTPCDPEAMDAAASLSGPSPAHWMGCDNFGRDIFSRVLRGCGNTLSVALATVAIGAGGGLLIGAAGGYFGGWLDEILMRVIDTLFAIPSILLALVFISLLGPGKGNLILALGIAFLPSFSRIVRTEVRRQRNMDYVKSARLAGASHWRIIFVHILPNTLPVMAPSVMIGFNNAVLAEAGMSYLGIGVQPPKPSLGRMLSEAQPYLYTFPQYALFVGSVIVWMVLGVSLLAEGAKKAA